MDYNITYRKKDNGIQVIISYKDNLGRWRQKSKQGFPDTREGNKKAKIAADNMLQSLKESISLNISSEMENLTVGELKKDYLDHIKVHREYNTYKNYEQSLKCFQIDSIEISKLRLNDVQKCIDKLVSKVSLTTIQRRTTIFKCMLNYASRQYNVPICNMSNLTLPSVKRTSSKRSLEITEQSDLLNHFKHRGDQDYYLVVLIATTCGLRVGEILGLTWSDIDFNSNQVTVNKQWKINKETSVYGFGDLKSKNSYRTVPVPLFTIKELLRIKSLNSSDKIVSLSPNFDRLINSTSTYSMSSNLGKILRRKFKITIHELRHTYATTLIKNGIDFKTAANLLGHDIEQTMRTYSHVTNDMLKDAANLISKIF